MIGTPWDNSQRLLDQNISCEMINVSLSSGSDVDILQLPVQVTQNEGDFAMATPGGTNDNLTS